MRKELSWKEKRTQIQQRDLDRTQNASTAENSASDISIQTMGIFKSPGVTKQHGSWAKVDFWMQNHYICHLKLVKLRLSTGTENTPPFPISHYLPPLLFGWERNYHEGKRAPKHNSVILTVLKMPRLLRNWLLIFPSSNAWVSLYPRCHKTTQQLGQSQPLAISQ